MIFKQINYVAMSIASISEEYYASAEELLVIIDKQNNSQYLLE